jgi:hypothetical protein
MELNVQLSTWENLTLAWQNASRGKRGRAATAAFELYLGDHLVQIQRELTSQTWQPGGYHSFYIHEPKRRLISAAPFRDRVVHHALCNLTTPIFERRLNFDCYANRPGKGTHRALDRCQQFARRYRYCLPCDVVQFFPAIDHAVLREILQRMLPDASLYWLIERILASGVGVLSEEYQMVYFPGDDLFARSRPRGLPIGNLTSQWWANCYLAPFDDFIKRELRVPGYVRYVDDFILFGDDKAQLWQWRAALIRRLQRFRLTIHEASAIPRPVTEGIPFLGFSVYPYQRRLKPRKGYFFRRKLKHLLEKQTPQWQVKASLQGWINHVRYANTVGLRKAVLGDCGLLAVEVPDVER